MPEAPETPQPPQARARENRRGSVGSVTVLLLTRPGGIVVTTVLDALAESDRRPDRVVIAGLTEDSEEFTEAKEHRIVASGVDLSVRPPLSGAGAASLAEVVADAQAALGRDQPRPSVRAGHVTSAGGTQGDTTDDSAGVESTGEDNADDAADQDQAHTAAANGRDDDEWWWILTDDARPEPAALDALIEATRRSTGVGIVGPKLVDRDDHRRLLSMGYQLTRAGRPAGSPEGEIDQGQYDRLSDTLGVPLAGTLIERAVLDDLGGVEPAFDEGTEGLDLSWRSHLAGHRVVLAPNARVGLGHEGIGVQRPWWTRVRTRQIALARGSAWALPWRTLSVLVTSLVAAFGLLLVKRPRSAGAEMADVVAVLSPWRGLGARWRNRSRVTVPRRHLRSLFDTSATAWRGTADLVQDALTPKAAGQRRESGAAVESGPVSEEAQALESGHSRPRQWWSWPVVLGLIAVTALTAIRWRDLWPAFSGSSAGVAGGELEVQTAGSGALWQEWWGSWGGDGLGGPGPAEPWLLPMSGLTWLVEHLPWVGSSASPAGLAASLVLVTSMPLAYLSCVLAARSVTDRRWPRVVAGIGWAALPPLSGALAWGRLGPVVVHVLAPLIVAGAVASLSRGTASSSLRTAAAFGTALATAIAGLFVPGVVLVVSFVGLLGVIAAPGSARLRAVVLLVVPWVLMGPWLGVLLENPRLIFGGAGATVADGSVEPWHLLLLHPGGATTAVLWWTVPILVLAALGTLRSGPRGNRLSLLAFGGVLGIAAAVGASLLGLGEVPEGYSNAGALVGPWPGTYLSLGGAAVVLAAVGAVRAVDVRRRWADWRQAGLVAGAGVAGAAVAGLAITTAWTGVGPLLRQGDLPHLAVAQNQADGADASRILVLDPGETSVAYHVDGREAGPWQRDLTRDLTPVTSTIPDLAAPDQAQLAATVALITSYQGEEVVASSAADADADAAADQESSDSDDDGVDDTDTADQATTSEASAALHALAVGYVQAQTPSDSAVAEQIDAVPGLVRLGGTAEVQLWRVSGLGANGEVTPARVGLVDAAGDAAGTLPVSGSHARVDTGEAVDLPAGGVILVSQSPQWAGHAEVRIDGEEVEPVASTSAEQSMPLRYPIPEDAGQATVSITQTPADRTWHLVTGILAVMVAFLALPFGARRRRGE